MASSARRLGSVALGCALLCASCIDLPDFPSANIIDRPRVLAVVVEPPEIAPGQSAELSLMVAGVDDRDGMQVTWRACGSFDTFFGGGGAQYGEQQPDEGCGGGIAFPLGEGETATLPGALTLNLFDNLEVIAMALGTTLPEDIVEQIRSQVGLAFLIEATVIADGKLMRAVKRVLISESDVPHTNPPPPAFDVGTQSVVADLEEPFRCIEESNEPVVVPVNVGMELAPRVDTSVDEAGVEPWLERYQVINSRGELLDRDERAFYSWFSTAGSFDQGVTKSPLRNTIWHTPDEPGEYPLWLVIRDGHGGTSACELTVTVASAP